MCHREEMAVQLNLVNLKPIIIIIGVCVCEQ